MKTHINRRLGLALSMLVVILAVSCTALIDESSGNNPPPPREKGDRITVQIPFPSSSARFFDADKVQGLSMYFEVVYVDSKGDFEISTAEKGKGFLSVTVEVGETYDFLLLAGIKENRVLLASGFTHQTIDVTTTSIPITLSPIVFTETNFDFKINGASTYENPGLLTKYGAFGINGILPKPVSGYGDLGVRITVGNVNPLRLAGPAGVAGTKAAAVVAAVVAAGGDAAAVAAAVAAFAAGTDIAAAVTAAGGSTAAGTDAVAAAAAVPAFVIIDDLFAKSNVILSPLAPLDYYFKQNNDIDTFTSVINGTPPNENTVITFEDIIDKDDLPNGNVTGKLYLEIEYYPFSKNDIHGGNKWYIRNGATFDPDKGDELGGAILLEFGTGNPKPGKDIAIDPNF